MSLRDTILAADDLQREPVEVPEWGCTVHVRVLTASERDQFEGALARDPHGNVRARLAALATCDESGRPVFTLADVAALGAKSVKAINRLVDAAMKLNAVGPADLDDLEKN